MSASATMILDQIKRAAPAGRPVEGVSTQRHLAHLVTDLLAASPEAVAEYTRYGGVEDELIRLSHRIAACTVWQILHDAGIDPASGPAGCSSCCIPR
jgi:hypothetical protein